MSVQNHFFITYALHLIQDQYAEKLFNQTGSITINGETARIIETMNCDHYSQIGVKGSNEKFLFDLEGSFYAVPETWVKPDVLAYKNCTETKVFSYVSAENIDQLVLTATSEEYPLAQGI